MKTCLDNKHTAMLEEYPYTDNKELSKKYSLCASTIKKIAYENNVKKTSLFISKQRSGYRWEHTEDTKKRFSLNRKGVKKPNFKFSDAAMEKHKERMKAIFLTKNPMKDISLREKASVRMINKICSGNWDTLGRGKSGYFESIKNNKIFYYRSSYELKMFGVLEKDSLVKNYEYEAVRVPYVFDGVKRITVVDFLVHYSTEEFSHLIEVKPLRVAENDEKTIAKLLAIRDFAVKNNYIFNLVTEKELFA